MKYNINNSVKVKLTDYGEECYYDYWSKHELRTEELKKDEDGFIVFQLWDFMNWAGEYCYLGAQALIEDNNLILLFQNHSNALIIGGKEVAKKT